MPEEVSYEEAVAIAREIGEVLGGRQQRAIEVLIRYAERGRRRSESSTAIEAFRTATEIVKKGLKQE
jgi:hypothetical protein